MLVSHILREKGRDIVAIDPEASLLEASRLLSKHRIGALIVRDKSGALTGILSERDIVRAVADGGAASVTFTVSKYMTKEVARCEEKSSIEEITETMTRGRFRHMPVVEKGRLMGIVSIGDVLKTRIAETVIEAQALKQYIAAG